MIWDPPGCSGSHRVTSSTMPSMSSNVSPRPWPVAEKHFFSAAAVPASFRARTSASGMGVLRTRSWNEPSTRSHASWRPATPKASAASRSSWASNGSNLNGSARASCSRYSSTWTRGVVVRSERGRKERGGTGGRKHLVERARVHVDAHNAATAPVFAVLPVLPPPSLHDRRERDARPQQPPPHGELLLVPRPHRHLPGEREGGRG